MSAQWNPSARRWYVDGNPVHAGDLLQIRGVMHRRNAESDRDEALPGTWFTVRIESRLGGTELDAYADVCGLIFKRHVAGFDSEGQPWAWEGFRLVPDGQRDRSRADLAIHARNELLQTAAMILGAKVEEDAESPRDPDEWTRGAIDLLDAMSRLPGWTGV